MTFSSGKYVFFLVYFLLIRSRSERISIDSPTKLIKQIERENFNSVCSEIERQMKCEVNRHFSLEESSITAPILI